MVEMADVQGARNAVETMHESVLHNSTLWVKKGARSMTGTVFKENAFVHS